MDIRSLLKLPTLELAPALLGMKLETGTGKNRTSGIIVETEAYHGDTDPACHCYYRRTPRNEVMFWEAGHCYVYMIYGMHYCVNVVSEKRDTGAAVLIRAVEPVAGIDLMYKRRNAGNDTLLSNGPAKLCQALDIKKDLSGEHFLTSKSIHLKTGQRVPDSKIVQTTRIGISKAKELPWRFYVRENKWVSKL